MATFEDLLNVCLNVRNSLNNLSKDVDEKDPREKTDQDLAVVTVGFDDMLSLFKSMEASDLQDIYREVMELSSGQETFQQYLQDMNVILTRIRNKAQNHAPTQEKIAQNLPRTLQNQDVQNVLGNYQQILENLNAWGKQLQNSDRR